MMFFKNAPESNWTSLFVLSILLLGASSACAMEDWPEANRWRYVKEKSKHKELTQEELNVLLDHYLHIEKNEELTKKESSVSHGNSLQGNPIDLHNPRSIYEFVEILLAKHNAVRRVLPGSEREGFIDSLMHDLSLLDLPSLEKVSEQIRKLADDRSKTIVRENCTTSRGSPQRIAQEKEDKDFEFYNQICYLDNYLSTYDLKSREIDAVHYAYYILGLRYFLRLRDYEKATSVFMSSCFFDPQDAYIQLKTFINFYFFQDYADVPKRPPADYHKARELYQKGLEAINLKEENYNIDQHEYMFGLSFIGNDFERARKHAEQYVNMASGKAQREMQSSVAQTLYHLKYYDEAEKYLNSLGDLCPDDYVILTHIYARKKEWHRAQQYIMKSPGGLANEDDALILAELIMNIKSRDFDPIRRTLIRSIKESVPSISKEIEDLVRTKNHDTLRNVIKKSIALQKLLESKQVYRNFDEQYKLSWIKASQAPEMHQDFLESINKLAELIEATHLELRSFDSEDPVTRCQSIIDSYNRLKTLCDEAELEFKQASFNMARSPGCLYSDFKTSEVFEFPSTEGISGNLKKEFRTKEKKNQKEKKKEKGEHKKKVKISLAAKSDGGEKGEPSENSLRSFGNHETEDIWNSRDVRSYPEKTLDLLDLLSQARSMFHLRQLTPPGAQLEMLQGARVGQLSLRINDQWRLCFKWVSGEGAYNVEIADYH
ncbi:MAG TPA: type II toxin-antitoxin system RelE/ParE family toxin [Alphaproteobacteria bacterium]|nr:type II toxin-antitoxin system RelE/ParE family toxin [Alphaproteobacteria bacterium]